MIFIILHLNIERDKHIDSVINLLKENNPQIVCFEEARYKDVESIASKLGYDFVFATRVIVVEKNKEEKEGSAILSKYPILNTKTYRYDDEILKNPPVEKIKEMISKNGIRPKSRFLEESFLLTASIKLDEEKSIIVSTTHFPVTDHSAPKHKDHIIESFQNIDDVEHSDVFMNRLIKIIRLLKGPVVFTADLNNPRGEYLYDLLAHELVDHVPSSLDTSIDPNLHRIKNLKLVVDTVMTTPDIIKKSFKVIEGVSDHKAFLVSLEN